MRTEDKCMFIENVKLIIKGKGKKEIRKYRKRSESVTQGQGNIYY